jgi:hypothetical protein
LLTGLVAIGLPACSLFYAGQYEASNPVITFFHKGCYGQCPEMSLILRGDGMAFFEGKAYVNKLGNYQKELPLKQIDRLVTIVEESGFMQADSTAAGAAPRQAKSGEVRKAITVRLDGEKRSIQVGERQEAPEAFRRLEVALFRIAQSPGWKKRAMDQPQEPTGQP